MPNLSFLSPVSCLSRRFHYDRIAFEQVRFDMKDEPRLVRGADKAVLRQRVVLDVLREMERVMVVRTFHVPEVGWCDVLRGCMRLKSRR